MRTSDHEPFFHAENEKEPYIIIYLFEPTLLAHADSALRHQQFIYHSILDLNRSLQKYNRSVNTFYADAKEVFLYLTQRFCIKKVFSYQENGTLISWRRDKKVASILNKNSVKWLQFENQAVKRGISHRVGWDKQWYQFVNSEQLKNTYSFNNFQLEKTPFETLSSELKSQPIYPIQFQPPGQTYAKRYLKSFVMKRGKNYSKHISNPQLSRQSCSRLSVYLAWGNISIRQVFQTIKNSPLYSTNKRSFNACLARLKWRSHFIQKFETDCNYEYICINKGYEKMPYENDDILLQKWKDGQTGFPLVDACMRCLKTTGWINFRMRAMLVSFLCHHLNQDWRRGVYHMANLFLDYEPGIHFTQFQMQAGVTGINSIRIYNPVKQSQEKDPDAKFIKKWVPELNVLSTPFIHQPWKLTPIDLVTIGIDLKYPSPIVEAAKAVKQSRDQLWALRKDKTVKEQSKKLLRIHVRPSKPKK